MKISKRSWHYRFLRSVICLQPYQIRGDLCGYMRQLALHVLLLPLYGLAIGVYLFGAYCVEKPLGWLAEKFGAAWYRVRDRLKRDETSDELENESLIGAWLRAKKDRLCPMIEFTDPSE